MTKGYQRSFLRAPFHEPILFGDEGFVHKARGRNISEGGILLDQLPEFPKSGEIALLMHIPSYPYFKNFTLLKMQTFAKDIFPAKIIRARGKLVRSINSTRGVDDLLRSLYGIQFTHLSGHEQKIIQDYVSVFASNLIYLQMLIDSWNTEEEIRHKTRSLARILGYDDQGKIADLRTQVSADYESLQWL